MQLHMPAMLTDQSKELPVRSVSEHPIQSPVLHRLYKDHFVSGNLFFLFSFISFTVDDIKAPLFY